MTTPSKPRSWRSRPSRTGLRVAGSASYAGKTTCAVITHRTPASTTVRNGARSRSRQHLDRVRDGREGEVGVGTRRAVSGEVLGTRRDARPLQAGDERRAVAGDDVGRGAERADADDGVLGVGVDVDHGRQGHVDADVTEAPSHCRRHPAGRVHVVQGAEGRVTGVGGAGRRLQAGDVATLLVRQHQHRAEPVQRAGQPGRLRLVRDVLGEPADPAQAGVDPAGEPVGDVRADETGHDRRVGETSDHATFRKRDHRSNSGDDCGHARGVRQWEAVVPPGKMSTTIR